jgi:hypothetical protein
MKTKFTKGEWTIEEINKIDEWVDIGSKKGIISRSFWGDREPIVREREAKANAQLISAAPDLFEALINIENDDNRIPATIWEMRNKALNKALGEEVFKTKAE